MNKALVKIVRWSTAILVVSFLVYIISPFFITKRLDEVAPLTVAPTEITKSEESSVLPQATVVTVPSKETTNDSSPQLTTSFPVVGTSGHSAEGEVKIVTSGNKQYLRYENFKTINGPDLVVYLSKDLDAKEYVSLGKLKATEGNINYEIPEGVDISAYQYALVWCDAFSVLFNSAKLK